MHKLDERDIQILVILQEEGRITKTALAKNLIYHSLLHGIDFKD